MQPQRLVSMTWEEVETLDKSKSLLFLPISPVEAHGPHLPVGTDLLAAEDTAFFAAELLRLEDPSLAVILGPSLPLGCADTAAGFPGTLSVKGQTLYRVVRDVLAALADAGFRFILICNHHLEPVHMKALLSAADEIAGQYGIAVAETASRIHYGGVETEAVRAGRRMGLDMGKEVHADVKETAYVQYRHPHWVKGDPERLPPVLVDIKAAVKEGRRTFKAMGASRGYIGSPSKASPDFGRLYLEELAARAADLALKMVRGEPLPPLDGRMIAFLEKHVRIE